MGYQPVALRSSGLFFCISDLGNVDPMYQYSLDFFKSLFTNAIMNSERSDDLEERLGNLNKEFLESLYRNICRSLFEKDKLIFSMLLTIKLMEMSSELNTSALMFLLTGGVSLGEELPENPTENGWMSGKLWGELNRLCKIAGFERFLAHFIKDHALYKEMYDRPDPQAFEVPAAMGHMNKF
jgi:dynein heavy chain